MIFLGWKKALALLMAAALINFLLIMPNHPDAMNLAALKMVPLELPVILLLLLIVPAQSVFGKLIRVLLVALIMTVSVVKIADYATRLSFDRDFNLIVDWNLVAAGWHTLAETIGYVLALLSSIAMLVAFSVVGWLLWQATGVWLNMRLNPSFKVVAVLALVGSTAIAAAQAGHHAGQWQLAYTPIGDTFMTRTTMRYVDESVSTVKGLRQFKRVAMQTSPVPSIGLLARLKGFDVLILFVESYGRSSFTNPDYVATHVPTLLASQARLAEKGLAMRSGWLTAAMVGGQSWLSHSTLASGLWISDQGRYRALLQSARPTLFHDAQIAGFRTVAIMPALRLPWPEGDYFGFDAIYQSDQLGYEGKPFNWITMPDQFALTALDRLERDHVTRQNLFAQVALISSHAPFTPVPVLLPWESVGDGKVFNAMAEQGDSPEVVWRDSNRVREQFKLAINYSLETVFDYVAHHADRPTLTIVLGDHEPARFISGVEGQDVAIHVIGSPELLAHLKSWHFTEGLIPAPDLPAWRMDTFRDRFVQTFSDAAYK
jgi:hypothetical protein